MHHRIAHTTPVMEHWLEQEIAQWINATTHRTMSERSYHGATSRSRGKKRNIWWANDAIKTSNTDSKL